MTKISAEAKFISQISRTELNLLYQLPCEVKKAIDEGRAHLIRENDELIGFGLWNVYKNDWYELTTLYVKPELRGRGYFSKMMNELSLTLKPKIKKAFAFSRNPIVIQTLEKIGFRKVYFNYLPFSIRVRIALNRLNPLRVISYLKFLKFGLQIFKIRFQAMVLD